MLEILVQVVGSSVGLCFVFFSFTAHASNKKYSLCFWSRSYHVVWLSGRTGRRGIFSSQAHNTFFERALEAIGHDPEHRNFERALSREVIGHDLNTEHR